MANVNAQTRLRFGDLESLVLAQSSNTNWGNYLVTGATGFMGSFFLYWRLQLPGKAFAVVRANSTEAAFERVVTALDKCAFYSNKPVISRELLAERLVCLPGDVAEPQCGLTIDSVDLLVGSEIQNVWHIASSLEFSEKRRKKLQNVNVEGTRSLLGLANLFDVERFVYVSTAYSSGLLNGKIKEGLHPQGFEFANFYEESKHQAEVLVHEYSSEANFDAVVARPSIIVGPFSTLTSGGTRFGMYGFFEEVFDKAEMLKQMQDSIRLIGSYNSTVNLVPVDHAIYDLLLLRAQNFEGQNVYHLTNERNHLTGDVISGFCKLVDADKLDFVAARDSEASKWEKIFDRRTDFYKGYYNSFKDFERKAAGSSSFDDVKLAATQKDFLHELERSREGLQVRWNVLNTDDGGQIKLHSAGEGESNVLLVNSAGMPSNVLYPVLEMLAPSSRVATWDLRSNYGSFESSDFEDFDRVVQDLGCESLAVVGWGTGAYLVCQALASPKFGVEFERAVLLNPIVGVAEGADSRKSLLQTLLLDSDGQNLDSIVDLVVQAAAGDDAIVQHYVEQLVSSHVTLDGFVQTVFDCLQSDLDFSAVECPVWVYGSGRDKISNPDIARNLAEMLRNAQLQINEQGTFFDVFANKEAHSALTQFLSGSEIF